MTVYPDYPVSVQGFNIATEDGTDIIRASSGEAWAYHSYPVPRYTFTLVHPQRTASEEEQIRMFYQQHKGEHLEFNDPRTGKKYKVLMMGPPKYRGIRSGLHIDIQMKLTGTEM